MTFEWALDLIEAAHERVKWIGDDHGDPYEEALLSRSPSTKMMIAVKEAVEHLRSALDYSGFQVVTAICGNDEKRRVYYPIARKGSDPTQFRQLFDRQMPGVLAKKPTLFELILSQQEFHDPDAWWLPGLAILSNRTKHFHLQVSEVYGAQNFIKQTAEGKLIFDLRLPENKNLRRLPLISLEPVTGNSDGLPGEYKAHYLSLEPIGEELTSFLRASVNGVRRIVDDLSKSVG